MLPATSSAPPVGFIADPLGPSALLASEGDDPRGRAQGIVLLLHGGGWYTVGPGAMETMRRAAGPWRTAGWRVINAGYRACGDSDDDALWAVDRIHALRPELPICIHGTSAGGHLGLLTAARRPGVVSCVVAEGAPTDPQAGRTQTSASGASAEFLYNLATAAFGDVAPITPDPATLRARVLLGTAENDGLVPFAQATGLRDALLARDPQADVTAVRLPAGAEPWTHGRVSAAARDDFLAQAARLAARSAAAMPGPPAEPPPVTPPPGSAPTPARPGPVAPAPAGPAGSQPVPAPVADGEPGPRPSGQAPAATAASRDAVRLTRGRTRVVLHVRPPEAGRLRIALRVGRRTLVRTVRRLPAGRTAVVRLRLRRGWPRRVTLAVTGPGLHVSRPVRLRG